MTEGFIQVTEPIFCDKDEHIKVTDKNKKIICILKGKFMLSTTKKTLVPGEVFGLDSILSGNVQSCDLIALEDSAIIEIKNKGIENIMQKRPQVFKEILSDTVDLINEISIKLI